MWSDLWEDCITLFQRSTYFLSPDFWYTEHYPPSVCEAEGSPLGNTEVPTCSRIRGTYSPQPGATRQQGLWHLLGLRSRGSQGDPGTVISSVWPSRAPNASPTLPFSAAQSWSSRKAMTFRCPRGEHSALVQQESAGGQLSPLPGGLSLQATGSLWSTRSPKQLRSQAENKLARISVQM